MKLKFKIGTILTATTQRDTLYQPGECFIVIDITSDDLDEDEDWEEDEDGGSVILKSVINSKKTVALSLKSLERDFVCADEKKEEKYVIFEDFAYKRKNLLNMLCKPITHTHFGGQEYVFVEMEEFIGGGSADGLGKKGHCIIVPKKVIKKKKEVGNAGK